MRSLLLSAALLLFACNGPTMGAPDPVPGVWAWRMAPAYQGRLDPKFMPVYLFEPDGALTVVTEGLGTIERGDWRRDAGGRVYVRLDTDGYERALRAEGDEMRLAQRRGEPFASPEPLMFRLEGAEAESVRARVNAYVHAASRPRSDGP